MSSIYKVSVKGGGGMPVPQTNNLPPIVSQKVAQSAHTSFSKIGEKTQPAYLKINIRIDMPRVGYTETLLDTASIPGTGYDVLDARSNSKTIASLSNNTTAVLQDPKTVDVWQNDKVIFSITSPENVNTLCYGGIDGTGKTALLATGATVETDPQAPSGILRVWNALTGLEIANYPFPNPIYSITYLENSFIALSFSNSGKIIVWDCAKMEQTYTWETGQSSVLSLIGMDNQRLGCGFNSGLVQVWQWNKKIPVFTSQLTSAVDCLCALNPTTLIVGTNSGWIVRCDLTQSNSGKYVYQTGSPLALQKIDPNHVVLGIFGSPIQILDTETWLVSWSGSGYSFTYGFSPPNSDGIFQFCSVSGQDPATNSLVKCTPAINIRQKDPPLLGRVDHAREKILLG